MFPSSASVEIVLYIASGSFLSLVVDFLSILSLSSLSLSPDSSSVLLISYSRVMVSTEPSLLSVSISSGAAVQEDVFFYVSLGVTCLQR